MNAILAILLAATVGLETVKLGTAPGKTMVVTGVTVNVDADIRSIASSASVTNAGAVAVAAADATTKANAAREQAKAASLSLADGGVINNNVRITGMYALKFGNTSDDGGNVNFSTVEQCFNSESPNYGRLLLSSAELMIWQEPIAIMSDITSALYDYVDMRQNNIVADDSFGIHNGGGAGILSHGTGSTSYMTLDKDVRVNRDGATVIANSVARYGDIPSEQTIKTYATNAVANSDNLWNQSNAKLTATIDAKISAADTTYAAFAQITNVNQSAQSVTVASGASLTILAPSAPVKDWIVYANCAADNTPLVLPSGQYYAADEAYTNALKAGVTALYFTTCGSGLAIGRAELKPITIP